MSIRERVADQYRRSRTDSSAERDRRDLLAVVDRLVAAAELNAWCRDGEEVATVSLADLARLTRAVAHAKEVTG